MGRKVRYSGTQIDYCMIRVLVTGASGFVGRQVMLALSKFDVELVPVVRKGKEIAIAKLPNIKRLIITSDLFKETAEWWREQCSDIELIIHAAWYAEPGEYLKASQNMDCLIGSLNLAKGASKSGVKRFVGIGTCFEYDLALGVLSVDTPLKPMTPYGAAKAALYLSLSQWLPTQSMEFVWCRLFYLYGEGEDNRRLVPYIRTQLENGERAELTSGRQTRDFLDVAEAGKKIANVALSEQIGPTNICSGEPLTVRQLAEQIADEYGRRDLLVFGARPDNPVDPSYVVGIN
jgi:nucleoside-diphosphate-sugar epimerase